MNTFYINKINDLMKLIKVHGEPDDVNEEINNLVEIIGLFGKLTKDKLKEVEAYTYIPHRNFGRLLFTSNKYDDALIHLETATRLFRKYDDIDSFNNNANSKRMIARCKIDIGLRDNDDYSIQIAKKILQNLSNLGNKISIESLRNEISDDLNIISGIEAENIITSMEFTLPFPLKLRDDTEVKFVHDGVICYISSKLIQSPLCPFESDGFIKMSKDKHGISIHSEIKLNVIKYIEPRIPATVSELTEETAFKPLAFAINAINEFIDHYKVSTEHYWIPRVTHKMVTDFRCQIKSNDIQVFSSPYSGNGVYSILPKAEILSDSEYKKLKEHLENGKLKLWELLYANSKDYILVKSYREAIIALNSAFENFLMEHVPEILRSVWTEEKIALYMNGKLTYENFFLKDYISEEDFNDAHKKEVIKELSPSSFHMIKTCCDVCKMKEKKRRYTYLVSKIRNGRNEVAHGNDYKFNEKIIMESLAAFDKFIYQFRLNNN